MNKLITNGTTAAAQTLCSNLLRTTHNKQIKRELLNLHLHIKQKDTPAVHSICTRFLSQPDAGTPTIKITLSLTTYISNDSIAYRASSMYRDLCQKYHRPLPTLAISLSYAYDPCLHPGRIISLLNDPHQAPLLSIAHKLWLHRALTNSARLLLETEAHLTMQPTHNQQHVPKTRYLFFNSSAHQERGSLIFLPNLVIWPHNSL